MATWAFMLPEGYGAPHRMLLGIEVTGDTEIEARAFGLGWITERYPDEDLRPWRTVAECRRID